MCGIYGSAFAGWRLPPEYRCNNEVVVRWRNFTFSDCFTDAAHRPVKLRRRFSGERSGRSRSGANRDRVFQQGKENEKKVIIGGAGRRKPTDGADAG